ncbi:cytochrome c peroxidase [Cyclobacterium sp. 1_MG-2023]|uniref:cytochrome-c peroxidase n=1 Tax=Cyclobacterium sp. 1_MG-2023 TaxID=3062681 RepID=UPI0026E24285|nr:cytochrome c peroxidase [Cyclobacterium sp. 1_MG-2023]MDO6435888.1 cytochrome c peroxidase [Cyclobacterium sp. 1_MG-2023]
MLKIHSLQWLLMLFAGGLFMASCDIIGDVNPPEPLYSPTLIGIQVPANFPSPVVMPDNPISKEGVLLGRTLFYDPELSLDGKVSCSSCHNQELAFSDGVSLGNFGVSGKELVRHSPTLINMAWMDQGFFWDGGSKNLESQAFGPLTHADEMGMSLDNLEKRLTADPEYSELFLNAFEDGLTFQNIAKALAQFERTLISSNSRYDKYVRNERGGNLNDLELKGLNLVQEKCSSCHSGELFTDNAFHNNGLDNSFTDESHELSYQGRYRITFELEDLGAFKTPTLRNTMVSAPYMHDGRFSGIEEVLEHYSEGVKAAKTTSRLLYQNNGKAGLALSDSDKEAIIAFLHTLTDEEFLYNPDFSGF